MISVMPMLSNLVRAESDPRILSTGPSSLSASDRMARTLGWLSFGLGAVQLAMPGQLTRVLGLRGSENVMRASGAREIAAGVLSLSVDKELGLMSRVAGDALDVAALMPALDRRNPQRDNAKIALAVVIGITVIDSLVAASLVKQNRRGSSATQRDYRHRSGFPSGVERAREIGRRAGNGSAPVVSIPAVAEGL